MPGMCCICMPCQSDTFLCAHVVSCGQFPPSVPGGTLVSRGCDGVDVHDDMVCDADVEAGCMHLKAELHHVRSLWCGCVLGVSLCWGIVCMLRPWQGSHVERRKEHMRTCCIWFNINVLHLLVGWQVHHPDMCCCVVSACRIEVDAGCFVGVCLQYRASPFLCVL